MPRWQGKSVWVEGFREDRVPDGRQHGPQSIALSELRERLACTAELLSERGPGFLLRAAKLYEGYVL